VTPDGIIVGDPLNVAFAQWLKGQLAASFPGRAVRYVLISHHHFDRAEGATVFTGAEVVAHSRYNSELSNARDSIPTFLGVQDRNSNGKFDPAELEGPNAALLLSRDRNHDGTVTPAELYRLVLSVRSSYGRTRTITLGGKRVELVHPGTWHSADMTVLFFPDERIVFAVDPPPVTAVPFSFGVGRPGEVYDWLHAVAPLDFDTLVLDDGHTMTRTALRELTEYLDELRAGVASGYERGQGLARIQATTLPQNYRGTQHYGGRTQQIADVYRALRLRRFELSTVGLANYGQRDPSFCSSYSVCVAGGAVPGGSAAASLLLGRRVGLVAEMVLGQQLWSTRRQPLYDEEVALRQTRGSALFRFSPVRPLAVLGGVSFTHGDVRGMSIVRGRLAPIAGRHEIQARESRLGLTTGLELRIPFGGGVSLVAPIRLTYTPSSPLPAYWPARADASAGIGISVRLVRVVH